MVLCGKNLQSVIPATELIYSLNNSPAANTLTCGCVTCSTRESVICITTGYSNSTLNSL